MIQRIDLDTIDSTHDWSKRNSHRFDHNALTCITALEQTAGHGRFGRKWISPASLNLYMTLHFTLDAPNGNLAQLLSLSAAAILEKEELDLQIKWPNDLLLGGKKIAGVLCESFAFKEKTIALLSIGLNVNMPEEMLKEINQPSTSLASATGRLWDLNALKESLLTQFVQDLTLFQAEGFAPFIKHYEKRLAYKEKSLCFFNGVETIEGIYHSILPDGRLELLLSNGKKVPLSSGEMR